MMTSHERFSRMFAHKEADRIPIIDGPWGDTIARWQREGMPADVSYVEYFGLDKVAGIGADNGPRWEGKRLWLEGRSAPFNPNSEIDRRQRVVG